MGNVQTQTLDRFGPKPSLVNAIEVQMLPSQSWLDEIEDQPESLIDEEETQEYFAERAHRKARKPPRRQTVKKLLEEGLKNPSGPKFGDPGLQDLFEREYFSELLWQLRSGKEATVYVVRATEKSWPEWPNAPLAAKLYIDSRVRTFKNDALYRQGRHVVDKRMDKAIDQRSQFGISAQNILWVEEEYRQLHALHKAGIAVPKPIAHAGNVILMEFIGDGEGPAPRLSEAGLSIEEAKEALEQAIQNLGLMLANGKIHGDYSTFNLLWWEGKAVVIDFPQVVEWDKNPKAREILERDVNGLCRTFAHLGLHPKGPEVLRRVWQIARQNATQFTPSEVQYL
jgi:RIO kinase 1